MYISKVEIGNALCDLWASINLMPLSVFQKLGLGEPRLTTLSLQVIDCSLVKLQWVVEDVLIKVGKFVILSNFIILDFKEDK